MTMPAVAWGEAAGLESRRQPFKVQPPSNLNFRFLKSSNSLCQQSHMLSTSSRPQTPSLHGT